MGSTRGAIGGLGPNAGMSLGGILRGWRLAAGLSQEALAERAGLSAKAIAQLETGKRTMPRADTLHRLAKALDLGPDERVGLAALARPSRDEYQDLPASTRDPTAPPLPVPLTPLIGREREIIKITRLTVGGSRLVTLTGPGGIGKTRLAIAVAHAVSDAFTNGAMFVSLAAVSDPDQMLVTVAHALGVPDAPGQPLLARLHAFLETQHRLLVLDNLEHLLDAAASLVGDLLTHCAHVTVLATSRSRIAVSGEQVVPLDVLDIEAARQLFTDRACAIVPTLVLSHDLELVVDAICSRLDRLPLAIELAAARVSVLPPRALLARLEQRLPLLTGHTRDAPARQRTMRSTIGWSFDLLSWPEQRLLCRLGAFAGGFTLTATTAVAGDDVINELETLVTSSLVRTELGVGGLPRFTMLETIREFALEKLVSSGEEADVRKRHAWHFATTIEGELLNQSGPDIRAAHDRIEADLQNCRAAMSWALETRDAEAAIRLSGALWRTWCFGQNYGDRPWRERMREGRDWLNRTLALRDGMPISVLAEALAGAAHLAIYDRDLEAAQSWAEELQTRTLAEPHAYGSYWAGRLLARFAINRHDWVTAKAMLAQASHAACSIPNPESGRSQALTAIAEFDDLRGDVQGALDHFRQALELGRISGNPHAITTAAIAYARLLRRQGELHYPASLLCEVLEHALGLRSFGLGNGAISELAYLALRAGQLERAVSYLAVADNLCPNSIAALNPYYGSYECVLAEARASLSTDAFSGAWEAGTMLTWQEAIAESRAFVHDLATLTEADSSLSVN